MGKIALELEQALVHRAKEGSAAGLRTHLLAAGKGWTVEDVLCTSGPDDRTFEERHARHLIALVAAGSFECRTEFGRELMTPGSMLLGNAGQCFECRHQHAAGDRCIAFGYSPELFEYLAADAGVTGRSTRFHGMRLPPINGVAPLVAQVWTGLTAPSPVEAVQIWQELSFQLAGQVLRMAPGSSRERADAPAAAVARVTRAIRRIDSDPAATLTLEELAQEAKLSIYHFLRTFQRLTGLTPHQYVRRARLRNAATLLAAGKSRVLDIALDCGFGDLANFNHAFRGEFGMAPLAYRKQNARKLFSI
ncbi:MAG TPA: AraC family transcriptional regulator [Candidatus Angelobacter sp.]|nr:AraC family transcriptional regulator [Candidatus Angelobacter sp.]